MHDHSSKLVSQDSEQECLRHYWHKHEPVDRLQKNTVYNTIQDGLESSDQDEVATVLFLRRTTQHTVRSRFSNDDASTIPGISLLSLTMVSAWPGPT